MKKTGLLLIGLTFAFLTNAQTLKIQGGTSISKLDWQLKGTNINSFYDETFIGYSIFAGIDYLDKKYYNLSTNIGMIRKGGKDEIEAYDEDGLPTGQTIIQKPTLDYLSINTMIDLKYRITETVSPFISFGPRIDYLVNSNKYFDSLEDINELQSTSIGLILGGGLKYNISNLQLGLRTDYYLNFTKVADWTNESNGVKGEVTVNTFTVNLTIGYKLK